MTLEMEQTTKPIPEERVAKVEEITYSGSIAIVTFSVEGSTFELYGDGRTTEPISAYIGCLVRLHIIDSADWTWQREEPNEEMSE